MNEQKAPQDSNSGKPVYQFLAGMALSWMSFSMIGSILGFVVGFISNGLFGGGLTALILSILSVITFLVLAFFVGKWFRTKGMQWVANGIWFGFGIPLAVILLIFGGCIILLMNM